MSCDGDNILQLVWFVLWCINYTVIDLYSKLHSIDSHFPQQADLRITISITLRRLSFSAD